MVRMMFGGDKQGDGGSLRSRAWPRCNRRNEEPMRLSRHSPDISRSGVEMEIGAENERYSFLGSCIVYAALFIRDRLSVCPILSMQVTFAV